MAKPIGTLGTIETLQIGGRVYTSLSTLITLGAKCSANQSTLRKLGSHTGAGYQVTTGKTLSIYNCIVVADGATAPVALMAQTDADCGLSASSAFSNPVYFETESSSAGDPLTALPGAGVKTIFDGYPYGTVNSTKYLSVDANSAGAFHIQAYGYEA